MAERKKLKLGKMVSDSTTVEKWREHPPSSFSLKIKRFSQFQKLTSSFDHKFTSHFFTSGGYNWCRSELRKQIFVVGFKSQPTSLRSLATRVLERKKLKLDMMVSDSTIVQKWRVNAPFSYSLKINNFSNFQKSTSSSDHKYRFRRFASGGYNWRLIVYPNGNEKDEGSGFISMYVEIDTASLMATPPNEVSAYLMFSIYNKKQNNYFVIHDVEAKRFNTLRTIWGFPQVISLDTFNDPKSGYIFDGDECEFGVDVIVVPPPTNCETLSFDNKLSNPKFSWTLKKFCELKEESYKSESFSRGGKSWVLKLYPKGEMMDGEWLSIFLHLADSEAQKLKEDEKIYVQTQLQLFDPSGSNHLRRQLIHWFDKTITNWGFPEFVSIEELRKMYLDKEDNLKVEIEFEVVSATN